MVTTSIETAATSLTTLPDGRIVAVGSSSLVRYNQNGSLDTTFDNDGIATLPAQFDWSRVAVQADGKVVVSGTTFGGANDDYALLRYNPNGSLDTTFGGGDGISIIDFNNSTDQARDLALDNQGRAVVAGISGNGSNSQFALARLLLEPRQTLFDFDGDGRADVSVFRPSDRTWYLNQSTKDFRPLNLDFQPTKSRLRILTATAKPIFQFIVMAFGIGWRVQTIIVSTHVNSASPRHSRSGDFTGDGRAEFGDLSQRNVVDSRFNQ